MLLYSFQRHTLINMRFLYTHKFPAKIQREVLQRCMKYSKLFYSMYYLYRAMTVELTAPISADLHISAVR